MQRCDWTLAACQEERAAVLRPKTQTPAGPGLQWSTSAEGIYTLLDSRKLFQPAELERSTDRVSVLLLSRPPRLCFSPQTVSLPAALSNPEPLLLMRLRGDWRCYEATQPQTCLRFKSVTLSSLALLVLLVVGWGATA